MMPVIPWYIELISIATSFAIALAVWTILSSAASRSGLVPAMQRRVRIGIGIFLGTWLGAALLLAPAPETLLGACNGGLPDEHGPDVRGASVDAAPSDCPWRAMA
jgi:hypothetical protein